MPPSSAGRFRILIISSLLYVAMTAVMGWPVMRNVSTAILSDAGDPLLNAAILSWNAKVLPLTNAWWNFPIFFPATNALTYSENLLGVAILSTPINWITGNPLITYNAVALLSFPLSALSMWALVYRLTRVPAAALLSGLAFGFAPYRIAQLSHVQLLAAFWMPLALLGLHAFLETGKRRWLVLFGASWFLQGTTNGYFLIFFSLFLAAWAAWFLVPTARWRDAGRIAVAGGLAALPLIPIVMRYLRAHADLGLSRHFGEVTAYSADMASFLCAPSGLRFWGWLDVNCKLEGRLFPGAALVIVLVAGSIMRLQAANRVVIHQPHRWFRAVRLACGIVALAYAAMTVVTLIFGPTSIEYGAFRVSLSRADKAISVALLFSLVLVVTSTRFRDVVRRSSVLGFYATAAIATWLLALGPFPTWFGTPVLYHAPYSWLRIVPGVDGLRVPARWWMLTVLSLSILLGVLMASVLRHRGRRAATAVVVVVAAGLIGDGWVSGLPSMSIDATALEAGDLAGRVVLKLPAGTVGGDAETVYRAVNGNWTSVNGYSGYEPPHYDALRVASERTDDSVVVALRELTDLSVIVSKHTPRLITLISGMPGAVLAGENRVEALYFIPRQSRTVEIGPEIPIHRVSASCGGQLIPALTDRHVETFWECGAQNGEETVVIDLGKSVDVGSIVHAFGDRVRNHPRTLVADTSVDGAIWDHAWSGSILGEVFAAAIRNHRTVPAVLAFTPRAARYVRLRQTSRDQQRDWSIAEIEIRRPR